MTVSNSFLRKNHNNLTPILSKLVKEKLKLKYFCFRVSGCIKLDFSPPQSYNIDKAETELKAPGGLGDLHITQKYFFNGRKNEKRKELVSPIQKRWVKLCDFPGVFYNVIPGPPPALQTSGGLDKVTKPSPVSSLQSPVLLTGRLRKGDGARSLWRDEPLIMMDLWHICWIFVIRQSPPTLAPLIWSPHSSPA